MNSASDRPPTAGDLHLMEVGPRRSERLVTLENWQRPPWNRWSYQHVSQIVPSARISRGDASVAHLLSFPTNVDSLMFEPVEGGYISISSWLERTYTDGFLVLHRGRIVAEEYFNGMGRDSLHLLQSVSKSMTGALAGVLVEEHLLEPHRAVTDYVEELKDTSFEGATVRHILDMLTGTKFSEDYEDPEADVSVYESAAGWRPSPDGPPGTDLVDYIRGLQNHRRHGETFEYRSILTDVLGLLIERATGRHFADAMSRLVWSRLGAERDAMVTVDRHGHAMVDGGISVTLRDLGRFGQMYLQSGCYNGNQIVPASWVTDTRYGDEVCRGAFGACEEGARYPKGHYRNQWWVPNPDAGELLASGIHGQALYINITSNIVVVKLSSLPQALNLNIAEDDLRACEAISAMLFPIP